MEINSYKILEDKIVFDCGCEFKKENGRVVFCADLHNSKNTINFECPYTYQILSDGLTQGIFQLGSPLGTQWTRKVLPTELEHISALGSVLRPSCMECISADTKIAINRKFHTKKITIKELYNTFKRQHIVSYNEETQDFVDNKIIDVFYKGKQDIYKVNIRENVRFYNLKCTMNHKLLVHNKGWIKLSEIKIGDRIAVTLDVNHINGDKVTKQQILDWAEYTGNEFVCNDDVYDIEVESPHNNYIAGNFIVHNSKDEKGNSITVRYERKKNGKMELSKFHPIVDKILESTYGENIYQEQSLELVKQCAGFNLQESDILRRGIGHKEPETIAKCKKVFMEKGKELGVLNEQQLEEVFSWIEASQRYSFNHSHAMSYAIIGYITAYIKAHFPVQFYKEWLRLTDKREDLAGLINEAKLFNINVYPPDIRELRSEFYASRGDVYFGLANIKGILQKDLEKISQRFDTLGWDKHQLGKSISWLDFVVGVADHISSRTMDGFIGAGALDCFGLDRAVLSYEYERWNRLSPKEKEHPFTACKTVTKAIKCLHLCMEDDLEYNQMKHREAVEKRRLSGKKYKTVLKEPRAPKRLEKVRALHEELSRPLYTIVDTVDSIVFAEENLLGVALTKHKTDEIVNCVENASCMDILKGRKEYSVLRVKIERASPWVTKNGQSAGKKMCWLTVSDRTSSLPAVAFAKTYEEYRYLLTQGNLVFISGQTNKDNLFIVNRVYAVS